MNFNYKKFLLLALIGIFTGLINGLLGIGGGTILIPAMVFLLGEKQHLAHGTSLSIILPTAIISTIIYQTNHHIDWNLVWKIALSGMIGGYCGARLMPLIPARHLRKLFGAFMFIAGLRMIF